MRKKIGLLFAFSFLAFFTIQVPVKADMDRTEGVSEEESEAGKDTYSTIVDSDGDVIVLREYQEGTDDNESRDGIAEDNRMQYITADGSPCTVVEERRSYEREAGEEQSLLESLADCELDGVYGRIGDIPEEAILSVEESGNRVVITYVISDENPERVTSRNIVVDSTVILDHVVSFTFRREIEFAYGIPYNGAHGAQIISAKAYISYVNSSSAYYPDTSSIVTTIGNMGNPAIVTASVEVYIKPSDRPHGRYTSEVYCYGDGDWK